MYIWGLRTAVNLDLLFYNEHATSGHFLTATVFPTVRFKVFGKKAKKNI